MKKINELIAVDKPREKLENKGASALKDYELMAILMGSGGKNKDVLQLSREIVKNFENDFDTITLDSLLKINGLGKAKASKIISAIELSRRYLIKQNIKITRPQQAYDELRKYHDKRQEYFLSITLDGASHLIKTRVEFIGTLNRTLVHPREIFAHAIADRAASIIVAHNHPSGTLEASKEDLDITKRLKSGAELLGIELKDHIIFSTEGFISLKEQEKL
ncbi:MAG: DNA repair protein RadC [Candidatus Thioglobus sp.]|uniref:RadC family protein n=1 Tax=Candidatus Thioglobus sp. TaxID=2026721 RepID=UPI0026190A03|nr:DNA repair protein RadC [Candidatus Thioglobus sp.]MDC9726507.1 DNA repair protein RadC [Candidatus Thioglobus sp.]